MSSYNGAAGRGSGQLGRYRAAEREGRVNGRVESFSRVLGGQGGEVCKEEGGRGEKIKQEDIWAGGEGRS